MKTRLLLSSVAAAGALLLAGARATAQDAPAAPDPPAPSAAAMPLADQFVIGPEDVLGIVFWREKDMSGDVAVRPDGRITLPLIGDLPAAGLRPQALAEEIQKASAKYLADPKVTVVVRQINSRNVFVTGLVNSPGTYALTGRRSVMQLLAMAGGVIDYASSENIRILRQEAGGTRSFNFNYKDVSQGRALQQNIQLRPGDTIVVP